MSKLLIEEPPLQVLPSLACLLGLNEALVLQQLHFRLLYSLYERKGPGGVLRRWVGYTLEQWHGEFPWWKNKKTVQRAFERLIERRLVTTCQFGKESGFRMNWYTIDYEAFDAFTRDHLDKLSSCPKENPQKQGQKGLFDTPHEDNLSPCPHEDKLGSSGAPQFVTMPITPNWGDPDRPNLSTPLKKDSVVVREKNINNNNTPVREAGASMINGVVVVVPDDEDAADAAIPTPRTKAYRLLRDYGVTEQAILPLIRAHSDSEIERQVAHLDFEQSQGKRLRNPGGRLAKMIREEWALPPGAEAAYRRRFLGEVAGEAKPPASVPEATPVEPDAFDLRLAALSEEERTTLRARAERLAREQNPKMSERLLESQVIYHMRRLLPRPSRLANDSQDAS